MFKKFTVPDDRLSSDCAVFMGKYYGWMVNLEEGIREVTSYEHGNFVRTWTHYLNKMLAVKRLR